MLSSPELKGRTLGYGIDLDKFDAITQLDNAGLAKKAGFVLIGSSEIDANPRDTKDWVDGVWTLPPTLSQGAKDRDRYIAVGEADNFVLKFRKPRR